MQYYLVYYLLYFFSAVYTYVEVKGHAVLAKIRNKFYLSIYCGVHACARGIYSIDIKN